jgi:MFS family permease
LNVATASIDGLKVDRRGEAGILAFGLAGLSCSALLPLTISFGQEQLTAISARMAGGVIAFYQLGYGIAAFGVGPLLDNGVKLSTIYGFAALTAVSMGLLSFVVARRGVSGRQRVRPDGSGERQPT